MASSVTLTGYPFDAQSVGEAQWNAMSSWFVGAGVRLGDLNEMSVFADGSGMNAKIRTGRLWGGGQFVENSTQQTLDVAAAHVSLARIDRVLVRVDWAANSVTLMVVSGTPSATPAAPSLVRSGTQWDFSLAQVLVDAGAASIIAGKVTDERSNPALCGYSYSPFPCQVCTSTTRPAQFATGGFIYETDTVKIWVNTGTVAVPVWQQLFPGVTFDATDPTTAAIADIPNPGTAPTAAHRDHRHGIPAGGTPVVQAYSDAAAEGVAATLARSDHRHGMPPAGGAGPSFATPAIVLANTAAPGVGNNIIRADSTIAAFDAVNPVDQAIADAAAVGAAAFAARRDHRHGMPTFGSPVAEAIGSTAQDGTALTIARADHRHSMPSDGVPITQSFGDVAAAGAAATFARSDHRHGMPLGSSIAFKTKTSAQSVSSNALTNDGQLFFSVAANERWGGFAMLWVGCTTSTPDVQVDFTVPSGTLANYARIGAAPTEAALPAATTIGALNTVQAATIGSQTVLLVIYFSFVVSFTPGTIQLRFAQVTTDAGNPTQLNEGSYLVAFKG